MNARVNNWDAVEQTSPWVLIRGLLREQDHWGGFVGRMTDMFPHSEIITLDIPGNGSKNSDHSPRSINKMVDDLRAQLNEKAVSLPLNLLGLSMGGMIVADWILSFPGEVRSAVVINSSMGGISPVYDRINYKVVPRLIKSVFDVSDERERAILDVVSNNDSEKSSHLTLWQTIARTKPISKFNALRQASAALQFRLPKVKPEVPTLVLSSAQDRLVNYRCSRAIARFWGSQYHEHPHAGHDLIIDQPEWVIERLSDWDKTLERLESVSEKLD